MHADDFDETEFFSALARSGARVLLIGRRAMIALGLPADTAEYELWIHIDDIEPLNRAVERLGFVPSRAPDDARKAGRYVLEDGEHVDVLVACKASTRDGVSVAFDDVWSRRAELWYEPSTKLAIPTIDDLILTKRWAMRDKDVADIRMLQELKRARGG